MIERCDLKYDWSGCGEVYCVDMLRRVEDASTWLLPYISFSSWYALLRMSVNSRRMFESSSRKDRDGSRIDSMSSLRPEHIDLRLVLHVMALIISAYPSHRDHTMGM
jgi:hypothetical protein